MRSHNIQLLFSILVYKILGSCGGNLPSEIEKCKSTDNDECIGKTIEQIFQRYPNGNPDFGMPSVAALNLTKFNISRSNSNSPIKINFELIKCTINGLENIKILRTSGFTKELNNIEIDLIIPSLRISGDYESTGKLLVLPLNGKGKGIIKLLDCKSQIRGKFVLEKRNGKNYAKVKQLRVFFEPEQMFVKLDNIFNGNPILSDSINDVINENWRDVWTEMQESINHAMENVLIHIASEILQNLAYDDFYAD